jgi:hypothetical protein
MERGDGAEGHQNATSDVDQGEEKNGPGIFKLSMKLNSFRFSSKLLEFPEVTVG